MRQKTTSQKSLSKELLYQLLLATLLFLVIMFDERGEPVTWANFLVALECTAGALFTSHILLPRFYYKKKFPHFWTATLLVMIFAVLTEEIVIEKYIFPHLNEGNNWDGLIMAFMDVTLVFGFLVGFTFIRNAHAKQKEYETLKRLIAENEIKYLKSQINPHFLFNNLNNLYSYAIEKSDKTPIIIHKLSEVLRYMLYDCHDKAVSITKEIEYLENFVELNRLQMEHRGEVNFTILNITAQYHIAPLILIVFVENAFKHSLSGLSRGINIGISATIENDQLRFSCVNNFSQVTNLKNISGGIGLKNVQSQLELAYPNKHKLNIMKNDNVFTIDLIINLN